MKELQIIQQELKAPKDLYNKFGNYKYRSAESILEALKPLLGANKCTLTFQDLIVEVGGRVYVEATARLTNESGETVTTTAYAREQEQKSGMDAAQITGAASSYARKYALNGMFAIDDTRDADSMDNSTKQKKNPQPEQAKMSFEPSSQAKKDDVSVEDAIEDLMLQTSREELLKAYNRHIGYKDNPRFMAALKSMSEKYPRQ